MSVPVPAARPRVRRAREVHELFDRQRASSRTLPDPAPLLDRLARGAIEVIAGVREPEQMARWLAEKPFLSLIARANLAHRARSARNQTARHPTYVVKSVRVSSPEDGVAEGVVVVQMPSRSRAVAIRLEGIDRRWRATALAIL
ncbi:Rv3235 family protein [Microbacterium halotolerans]|uniref:Rv3235 family protein n=1 Tax=Microbacterium halotolerans TaxID=246613 RepID=UPI000E6A980F|nr:Rv3235 family protein [Microbacterium halotolerans]